MPMLSISTLGPLEIRLEDAQVTALKSTKARALLVFLAVEAERAHRREMLAEMLWPGHPGRTALNNLRYALSGLRKAIADHDASPHHLLADRETIQFNRASDYRLDMAELARNLPSRDCNLVQLQAQPALLADLERGVQAYTGRFLEGFTVKSENFNEWALVRREEIERRVLAGLRCLAEYWWSRGSYYLAEKYLHQQLALEPWNEQAHFHLMQVMALDGRRSAALSHFDVVRRLLQQELDMAPAPETLALVEQIRRGELAQPPPDAPAAGPQARPAGAPTFVDRAPQLARLEAALHLALAGQGQVLLVSGDPGSGKTMLLEEFAYRACQVQPDLLAAAGNCSAQAGISDPLLPFQEIYHTLAPLLPAKADDRFAQFFQAYAAISREPSPPSSLQDLASYLHMGLLNEALGYVRTLAQDRPLLMTVHHMHWADRASLSLFFYLAQRLDRARVLLVGAFRPPAGPARQAGRRAQEGVSLAELGRELRLRYGDVVIDLNQADGCDFVDALLDAEPNALGPEFRRWLCDMTGGTPLLVVELLEELRRTGSLQRDKAGRWMGQAPAALERIPARAKALLALQLDRLGERPRRLLEVASVRGPVFTAEVVAPVADMAADEAVRLLSGPLCKAEHLVTAGEMLQAGEALSSHYRFRQGLLQQYLYHGLDEGQRLYWHRAIAEALEAATATDETQRRALAADLAWQFEQARLPARAAPFREMAAR